MALTLTNGSGDVVNHGSASMLDTLSTWTKLLWIKRTGSSTWMNVITKDASPGFKGIFVAAADEWRIELKRTGTDLAYETNNANCTINNWWCMAFTFDAGGAAGEAVNIYRGSLTSPMSECSYGTSTDGNGSVEGEGAGDLRVGSATWNSCYGADYGLFAHWDKVLTLEELIQQQQSLVPVVDGSLMFSNYGFYGASGANSQVDWSGNGNHGTPTGAVLANHVPIPLGLPFAYAPNLVEAPLPVDSFIPAFAKTLKQRRSPLIRM